MELYQFAMAVLSSMLGGLAIGFVMAYLRTKSAPHRYVHRIRKQIDKACAEGADHAIKNAKIIIASRNVLVDSLQSLGILMNSELDKLEGMLGSSYRYHPGERMRGGAPIPQIESKEVVFEQILVLKDYWEAREDTVTNAIKKIMVDLNIL